MKPFCCDSCGKRFALKSDLKEHILSTHRDKGESSVAKSKIWRPFVVEEDATSTAEPLPTPTVAIEQNVDDANSGSGSADVQKDRDQRRVQSMRKSFINAPKADVVQVQKKKKKQKAVYGEFKCDLCEFSSSAMRFIRIHATRKHGRGILNSVLKSSNNPNATNSNAVLPDYDDHDGQILPLDENSPPKPAKKRPAEAASKFGKKKAKAKSSGESADNEAANAMLLLAQQPDGGEKKAKSEQYVGRHEVIVIDEDEITVILEPNDEYCHLRVLRSGRMIDKSASIYKFACDIDECGKRLQTERGLAVHKKVIHQIEIELPVVVKLEPLESDETIATVNGETPYSPYGFESSDSDETLHGYWSSEIGEIGAKIV